ncbi:MAG: bile acid:sodium symporter family protein [Myxococcota bacterium]
MEDSVLTSVILPLSLFIIMLGMGLSLVPDDFRRVVRFPKAFSVGLVNQLILLPILGFLLAVGFGLAPTLAVGLMILAACPGGVTSNLIAHVSRGDTALSITLTAINSAVTVITIPLIVSGSLAYFLGESQPVTLPVLKTIAQIVGITVLPVSIGMLVRNRAEGFATRMEQTVKIASAVLFVVITLGIIAANLDLLKEHFVSLAGVTIALNVLTMAIGFISSRLFGLTLRETITVSIESGIQNGTLAIVIATSILKMGDLALPAGIYSLVMFATGGAMMAWFGTGGRVPDEPREMKSA